MKRWNPGSLVGLLALFIGCSSESAGVDAKPMAADAAVDRGADQARRDVGTRDAAGGEQLAPDQGAADSAPDQGVATTGNVEVTVQAGSQVTCGATPENDCKGVLRIGYYEYYADKSGAWVRDQLLAGDLSGGKAQTWDWSDQEAGTTVLISAHLYEDDKATRKQPISGDLKTSDYREIVVPAGDTLKVSVTLDVRVP